MDFSKLGKDELQREKTAFIAKMEKIAVDIASNDIPPQIIGGEVNKGIIVCAMEDVGDDRGKQMLCAGMGSAEMMESVAEGLIDHPVIGQLLRMKLVERMMIERFGSASDDEPKN